MQKSWTCKRGHTDQVYTDPKGGRHCRPCQTRRASTWKRNQGYEQRRLQTNRRLARRRHELVVFLGGICVRCNFSDERALQIDHAFGDGNEERRLTRPQFYRNIRMFPEAYQLLCANCNVIKAHEEGEYGKNRTRSIPW